METLEKTEGALLHVSGMGMGVLDLFTETYGAANLQKQH